VDLDLHDLFQQRQRLIHSALLKHDGGNLRNEYLALRAREEDLRYRKICLENALSPEQRLFQRERRAEARINPRLRIWINVLIIVTLFFILFMMLWSPGQLATD
jgi:hypothetical protein